MSDISIRPIYENDRPWVERFTAEHWGSDLMISRGSAIYISQQKGFVAEKDGAIIGLVTYRISERETEITSLDSLTEGVGVGTALIEAVISAARLAECRRLFLITTNDNTHALRFYQRRGFRLAAVYINAVADARKRKPEIPLTGSDGIPIRDEIELEFDLQS